MQWQWTFTTGICYIMFICVCGVVSGAPRHWSSWFTILSVDFLLIVLILIDLAFSLFHSTDFCTQFVYHYNWLQKSSSIYERKVVHHEKDYSIADGQNIVTKKKRFLDTGMTSNWVGLRDRRDWQFLHMWKHGDCMN